ncbi:MAG: ABC transporter ATP-binding protein [Acidimicrobiales bacterium]
MTIPATADGGVALAVSGLRHSYRSAGRSVPVLDGVGMAMPAGSYAAITGSSGAGKTTLLAILGGLERAQEGKVEVGGHDIARLTGDDLAAYRRTTVGFVFQHFGLLDTLTAAENVELAATLSGLSGRRRRTRAAEVLDALGLSSRAGHRPAELSGGERQRVAIARALVNRPKLLLADEPTGNLDDDAAAMVIDLLETLRVDRGCTLVVVTHNRMLASRAELHLPIVDGQVHPDSPVTAFGPRRPVAR